MSPERQAIEDVLADLPVAEKLAALAGNLLMTDPRGSILNLVEAATIMASHLSPGERAEVAWLLAQARLRLEVQWQ